MAEISAVVVSSLLLKLSDTIFEEVVTLYGVTDKVESLRRDLIWIQHVLQDADSRPEGAGRDRTWVAEVWKLFSFIEDSINTMSIEVEKANQNEPGMMNTLKRMAKKPMILVAIYKFNIAIKKIRTMTKENRERRHSYGIKDLAESNEGNTRIPHMRVISEIEETYVVGFDDEKNKMIELLLDENNSRRSVVSIVGMAGLGKTTLAIKIYQSVRDKFDFVLWLTVSKEYRPIALLKEAVKAADTEFEDEIEHDEEQYITELGKFLTNKRYFIVLDDVYSDRVWPDLFEKALPDDKNASRVLITTRFTSIAKAADPRSSPCELHFLNEDESLNLLFKKALPGENLNEVYPPELLEVAKSFSKQCGGLPLALVVVGDLLSTHVPNGDAWDTMLRDFDWKIVGRECMEILASSYQDLPFHLKTCFMYFSSLPKDYKYEAKAIIRLWVAEGFTPFDAIGDPEEIADEYLEELAQRCMIQVLKRSCNGSIEYFQVHDLLHNFSILKAKENNFLNIISNQEDSQSKSISTRAIFQLDDSNWDNISFETKNLIEYTNRRVHTLIFFGKVIPFNSQFQLLRVLVINGYTCPSKRTPYWCKSLKKLFNLRYLMFKTCVFKHFVLRIDHLHHFQSLVILDCAGIEVPMSLWGVKTLRHVLVNNDTIINFGYAPKILPKINLNTLVLVTLVEVAISNPQTRVGVTIDNLQTLVGVTIDKPGIELLNMPNVDELHLCNQYDSWDPITSLLAKLNRLVSLTLEASKIPLEIIDTRLFSSYHGLQTLCLNGVWEPNSAAINADMFPENLTTLKLVNSQIDQALLLVLEKLPKLKVLSLFGAHNGKQLISSTGGFETLIKLELSWLYKLEEWTIEEGAMPVLNELVVCYCKKLRMVPDLQHVSTLNTFTLRFMPANFKSMMKNEDEQHKIKHIESIIIEDK